MRRLIFAIALCLSHTPIQAQTLTEPEQMFVLKNYQQDFIECYTFHFISAAGFSKKPKTAQTEEIIAAAIAQRDGFLGIAIDLMAPLGQRQEGLHALLALNYDTMGREMGGTFSNYSVLLSKYLNRCVTLAKDPKSRLDHLQARK